MEIDRSVNMLNSDLTEFFSLSPFRKLNRFEISFRFTFGVSCLNNMSISVFKKHIRKKKQQQKLRLLSADLASSKQKVNAFLQRLTG